MATIDKAKLAELVARLREQRRISTLVNPEGQTVAEDIQDALVPDELRQTADSTTIKQSDRTSSLECQSTINQSVYTATDRYGNSIELNSKQREFVDLAVSGKSCVLIGAAGTGKTTCQGTATQGIIQSGRAGILTDVSHKHLKDNAPGIVICAYTRRAVANIRKNVSEDLKGNCITIHKLLEYQPVYYDVIDEESGETKTKMVFEPARGPGNPLPSCIHTIVFEEGSMLAKALHKEVIDACPHNVQFIYLGDIQQLPPIFGPAILGFKLLELPVVELTEVYRQALESPIIALAHRILSAKPIPAKEFPEWSFPNQLTIRPWKKKIDPLNALQTLAAVFTSGYDNGIYDPEEDMILLPFNKACGTIELNNFIANHLARKRGAVTHQIIAGFNKIHLSEGDKVLYDKEDATILAIQRNPAYLGAEPATPSTTLDYWGFDPEAAKRLAAGGTDVSDDHTDFLLSQTVAVDKEDRVKKCSHCITLQMRDSETEISIDSAGDVNSLLLGYALTVHKAQGSEWRKVFFCLHQSHATMVQRELLYTAVTRAKEELYIICEPESFTNGILSQRVKGNTLAEKAEFFKGKLERDEEEKLV